MLESGAANKLTEIVHHQYAVPAKPFQHGLCYSIPSATLRELSSLCGAIKRAHMFTIDAKLGDRYHIEVDHGTCSVRDLIQHCAPIAQCFDRSMNTIGCSIRSQIPDNSKRSR